MMKHSFPRKSKPRANSVGEAPTHLASDSFPIVGIGASAGGLEAFRELLQHLSRNSGMGFVLVQHLAPRHESALPDLLSRSIGLAVSEVKDGMMVQPNHVYVIPPNTNMAILRRRLHLVPRTDVHGHHLPIDHFLHSLAVDRGSTAIGVILSGTGSDGTLGMKAIKAEGGITFAQDEKSAKYPGMPQSAVAAGWVDFVLPPREIAAELEQISRHPYLTRAKAPEMLELPPKDADEFRKILFLLRNHSRVDFELYKHTTIKRRVRRRMVVHNINRLRDYVKFLEKNNAELDALFQDILIHVTGFFRDPSTFEALKAKVFPALLAGRKPRTPIRIWVPGCSTGEEVYSVAIVLLEYLGDRASEFPMQMFATDISESSIERARTGIYMENITADVNPGRLQRFFARVDQGYQISKQIRDACVFAKHDLTRDPPFSRVDLVTCRNVLIYLGSTLQKRVLSFFEYAIKPGGFLLLGTSESIGGSGEHFAMVDKKQKIYLRKISTPRPVLDFQSPERALEKGTTEGGAAEPIPGFDLQKAVDRVLLTKYVPAGIVFNEDLQILHFGGRTGAYLEPSPGQASLTLMKMAREGLLVDLRTLIHRAKRDDRSARKESIELKSDGRVLSVDVEVAPIKGASPRERYYLILFEEARPSGVPELKKTKGGREARRQKVEERESVRLREELAQTKASLQSIIEEQETTNEELRSANEEILSSNEELQSTNEELETAKEELQSSNEELTTLNEELQNRNVQMSVVNSDLNNLLASIHIPIVMVGSDLCIRRFTPIAEKVFNIIPSDLGRPIGNIRPSLEITDLEEVIRESIETISTREREVQDREGRWYSLRVRPYRTVENKIEGAVVVLLDIDVLKSEVTDLRLHAEAIVETVQTPLLVLDGDLRVMTANRAFYESFRISVEATENQLICDLANHQWDIPRLRELLGEILPKGTSFRDFEVTQDFPGVGTKVMLLSGRQITRTGESNPLILLAMEDITDRRQAESQMRDLLESAPDAVVVANAEGNVVLVNAEFESAFGYRREEVTGADVEMLIPERFREPHLRRRKDYFNEPRRRIMGTGLALFGLRKDGSEFPVEISLSPLKSREGTLVISVIRDVTERKRAENALSLLVEGISLASEGENAGDITSRCIELICKLTGWKVGQSWYLDEDQNVLRCDPQVYYSEIDADELRRASLERTYARGESLPGLVWDVGSPVWIKDVETEVDFGRQTQRLGAGVKCAFVFPIGTRRKFFGVWEFFSTENREPEAPLLEVVAKLGKHIGLAYERLSAMDSIHKLNIQLIKAQDEERRKIARELHDSTSQLLASVGMNLSLVAKEEKALSPKVAKLLSDATSLVASASDEVRTIAHLLHPPLLDEVGLASALRWFVDGFVRRTGIAVRVKLPNDLERLSPDTEAALFRITQECLTNTWRHSGSSSAALSLTVKPDGIILEIKDEGKGMKRKRRESKPLEDVASALGVGIAGMHERVKELGGELKVASEDKGTLVRVVLPRGKS